MKINKIFIGIVIAILSVTAIVVYLASPLQIKSEPGIFTVPQEKIDFDFSGQLTKQGFIRNELIYIFFSDLLGGGREIHSGGYKLDKNMWAWQVALKLVNKPDLVWVSITGCQRKEQIGEKLAMALNWNDEELKAWNRLYENEKTEYFEGVYYPDTYLIPVTDKPQAVAERFITRFNEEFNPLASLYVSKNIRWPTGLKIASLISREAAGTGDMNLISGIIWNRLDKGMVLQIDATLQYTHGQNPDGSWWGPVSLAEKQSDSPYNSYIVKTLPPTPICSPGIDAIKAVLNPTETDCLYYLHDADSEIHCAKTYTEHKANIDKYLK